MSWFKAIFVNWFGIKLMIPFIALFFNFWIGILGLIIWVGSYVYYFNKKQRSEIK